MERMTYEEKKPILDMLGYTWSAEQESYLQATDRVIICIGGERGGKSAVVAADKVPYLAAIPYRRPDKFFAHNGTPKFDPKTDKPRHPHVVLFGPHYTEPRIEFDMIEEHLDKLGMLAGGINAPSRPQDGPYRLVTTDGVVVQTFSCENPNSIRAMTLEFAVICEAGMVEEEVYRRVRSRVATTHGFIDMSGTLELAQRWYVDKALEGQRSNPDGWRTVSIPIWSNLAMFPGGINDPEIQALKKEMPEDIWAMRFAAEPRPPIDRVIPEFTDKLIKDDIEIPENAEIQVWIDPGYASAFAILWVAIWEDEDGNKFFYVFDEFYEQGKNAHVMSSMIMEHPMYDRLMVRHRGVIDIAGKGHRDATESAEEVLSRTCGITFDMGYWTDDPLRERLRTSCMKKQFAVNSKCVGLLAEMGLGKPVFRGMHHWRYVTDKSGNIIGERPEDKWNHSVKALAYGLLEHLGQVEYKSQATTLNRLKKNKGVRNMYGWDGRSVR